jgi:hypothetical protein
MFDYFIQNFENSLSYNINYNEKNGKNNGIFLENSVNDSNVAWEVIFFEVLKKRKDLRKIEAGKRVCKNNDDNDSDYDSDDNDDDGNLKSENQS